MSVVQLHQAFPAQDIPATLRRLADEIEAGEFGLMTTAALCLGHTEERPDGDTRLQRERYELFELGPRADIFTVRGLLLTCATQELGG